jgi:hypothetical protein
MYLWLLAVAVQVPVPKEHPVVVVLEVLFTQHHNHLLVELHTPQPLVEVEQEGPLEQIMEPLDQIQMLQAVHFH